MLQFHSLGKEPGLQCYYTRELKIVYYGPISVRKEERERERESISKKKKDDTKEGNKTNNTVFKNSKKCQGVNSLVVCGR